MKSGMLWKTSVVTTVEAGDAVAELLAATVAPGPSSYTDADTGVTTVSVYSSKPPRDVAGTRAVLRRGLNELKRYGVNAGPARVRIVKLPPTNWADSWKRHFPPLAIGGALLVKPGWSRRKPRRGQALVVLDPGLSFGTGQHPTTEYCLRQLVARRAASRKGCSLLDAGTGSGILAISGAKLGCAPVHAFDFDPQCIRVAKANAAANGVANQIRLARADLTKLPSRGAGQYDIVCANLLADLLITGRDRLLARVKPGGVLVVAGILRREFAQVRRAYEAAGLRLIASRSRKEWRSGTFRRARRVRGMDRKRSGPDGGLRTRTD
jgi:ribosomal protein L11 methyltransferase